MIDKNYCMSSYMAFRFVEDDTRDFYPGMHHKIFHRVEAKDKKIIYTAQDIDKAIQADFDGVLKQYKRKGLLLSGGMDSGILAAYMSGCDAYTFRFIGGNFQQDELKRAELFAKKYNMTLHYVDIDWNNTVEKYLDAVMQERDTPVHSIEPQIMQAALQAKEDGMDIMVIGAGSDDVFGGIDKLLSKDWKYEEFKKRFMYTDPKDVLVNPVDMDYAFAPWKKGEDDIDYMGFLDANSTIETDLSFQNAFETAGLNFYDPYASMELGEPLDLNRIRNGESKYLIRALFALKYPEIAIPEKLPMPRPVDYYFKDWQGPQRKEFRKDLNMQNFTGNQKWQMYCLERFLNLYEPEK
jgi:asparagine synthetase B (glutamine-hydrolysing)